MTRFKTSRTFKFSASSKSTPVQIEEIITKLRATSNGKIHLSDDVNSAHCSKKNLNLESPTDLYDTLKMPKSSFCKRCFDRDPHQIVREMIALLPEPAVENDSESQLDAIYKTIEKLNKFVDDDVNNTRYMRLKTSCYVEALEALTEMIETNNINALKRLIIK